MSFLSNTFFAIQLLSGLCVSKYFLTSLDRVLAPIPEEILLERNSNASRFFGSLLHKLRISEAVLADTRVKSPIASASDAGISRKDNNLETSYLFSPSFPIKSDCLIILLAIKLAQLLLWQYPK